jgi:hypothetical protein
MILRSRSETPTRGLDIVDLPALLFKELLSGAREILLSTGFVDCANKLLPWLCRLHLNIPSGAILRTKLLGTLQDGGLSERRHIPSPSFALSIPQTDRDGECQKGAAEVIKEFIKLLIGWAVVLLIVCAMIGDVGVRGVLALAFGFIFMMLLSMVLTYRAKYGPLD